MKFIAIAAAVTAVSATVCLRPTGDRDDGQGPPRDPYMVLFDTNNDDEISTTEMEASVSVLKKLDQDNDGYLTREELPRPPRPGEGRDHAQRRKNEGAKNQRPGIEEDNMPKNAKPGTVVFSGGHDTDRRDGGRPVALIAAALGVKPQVFRDAFSNVSPSRGGSPSAERAQANKKVLMDALGKHGVSNDRLDTVSNYYRYRPGSGSLWRHKAAKATAVIKDGKVVSVKVTESGSGYMTAPQITIAGHENVKLQAKIGFGKELATNGRITEVTIVN